MKCKNETCTNEVSGRQVYCKDSCRKAASRTNADINSDNSDAQVGQTEVGQHNSDTAILPRQTVPSLQHYKDNPDMYATRTNPDKINWGKCMSMSELEACDYTCNREKLPGDWDYDGKCIKVDGVWKVPA